VKKDFQFRREAENKLHKRNEQIRVPYVTLINDEGERIENCPTSDALKIADDKGLDLVLVAPNLNPPVAKIMDWGKYKYETLKKQQEHKKLQKIAELKEIRLRPKTGPHDLEIKIKKTREFLEKGHKVKIAMLFKGREAAYLDKGRLSLNELIQQLSDISKMEDRISYQFKRLSVTLSPIKNEK
jgi:translation initiation factor IF-3